MYISANMKSTQRARSNREELSLCVGVWKSHKRAFYEGEPLVKQVQLGQMGGRAEQRRPEEGNLLPHRTPSLHGRCCAEIIRGLHNRC